MTIINRPRPTGRGRVGVGSRWRAPGLVWRSRAARRACAMSQSVVDAEQCAQRTNALYGISNKADRWNHMITEHSRAAGATGYRAALQPPCTLANRTNANRAELESAAHRRQFKAAPQAGPAGRFPFRFPFLDLFQVKVQVQVQVQGSGSGFRFRFQSLTGNIPTVL